MQSPVCTIRFEGFNRAMWNLNYDYFDPYLARPVSLAYVDYTPSFIRTGIKNFLANLDEPASMVNSALDAKRRGNRSPFQPFLD